MAFIVEFNTWPITETRRGITLWPFVLVADKKDKLLVEHEMVHIEQARRGWVVGFYLKYLYYHYRYGYKKNPYEIEARELAFERWRKTQSHVLRNK